MAPSKPLGISILPSCNSANKTVSYKVYILIFTFIVYTSFHLSRKPISIVKSVLHRNCSKPLDPGDKVYPLNSTECDWKPFDKDSSELLGALDVAYLFAYAVGMFVTGHVAERMNLRYFLSLGMILSGIFTAAFGFGYFFNIHMFWFYIVVQLFGGFVQSTGWPSVVTCVGNWYGKGKRGLIMGIWNSHTSVGNILGSVIASTWVNHAWGWSFVVPGIIVGSVGVLSYFFLVTEPSIVDCDEPEHQLPEERTNDEVLRDPIRNTNSINSNFDMAAVIGDDLANGTKLGVENPNFRLAENGHNVCYSVAGDKLDMDCSKNGHAIAENGCKSSNRTVEVFDKKDLPKHVNGKPVLLKTESTSLIKKNKESEKAITIWRALFIPGVIEFSLCLFCAKLVSYTFLFWLPKYISAQTTYNPEESGDLSTLFDVGGIAGGITAGLVSDITGARACTCVVALTFAAPLMYIYNLYGSINYAHTVGLLIACGFMVNAPYSLITTAVSADLGTHKSLQGNSKALATVTAIIDGTGSVGAALGPLLTGIITNHGSWNNVFWMLIAADIIAMVFLLRLVYKEILGLIEQHRNKDSFDNITVTVDVQENRHRS